MNKEQQYIRGDWFKHFPLGQEEPGERHWLDDAEKQLGGNEKDVLYYFNDWRYRGTVRPGSNVSASFGCSHALGYGVQIPYAEIIGYANCAISGISNDAIARLAYSYCEQFSPPTIVVLWTFPLRREYVDESGLIKKIHNDNETFILQQNDYWDQYNLTKNKLFLDNYCRANGIKLIDFEFADNDKGARDNMHPGPDWHVNMAALIMEKLNDSRGMVE